MTFNMASATPSIAVRTYSTFYRKDSLHTLSYAAWYRVGEKPEMTDEAFMREDAFTIPLDDFRSRFDQDLKQSWNAKSP